MPGGDRTGPAGMGPMTGRAAGYCAGYDRPGYANSVPGYGYGRGYGRGWGRGYGRGMGWGRGYGRGYGRWAAGYGYPAYPGTAYPAPQSITKDQEAQYLKQEAEQMKAAMEEIQRRLDELSASESKE